jgi:hypothetical protein
MTAKDKAEKMLNDLYSARDAMKASRGTWYLWEHRDKYAEVVDRLAKTFTDD